MAKLLLPKTIPAISEPCSLVCRYFHFKHDMLGYVVLILCGFIFAFWAATCFAYAKLNFQRR
jgi:hypothetical protein